jgi:uncharacterized MnhB-related membrane protein
MGTSFSVNYIAKVAAIIELTAIPMLYLLVVLPILSTLLIVWKGSPLKSLSTFSFMTLLINVLLLVFKK